MASRKKSSLAQFEDNELRLAYTNLLLEQESPIVLELLKQIGEECNDRNKDFIPTISNEEVRCMWVTSKKKIPEVLQSIIDSAMSGIAYVEPAEVEVVAAAKPMQEKEPSKTKELLKQGGMLSSIKEAK